MTPALTWAMAIATAMAVANNYYCQPLIGLISRDLPGPFTAYMPTAAQAGYALGLFVLVPLGDMIERRRMAVIQFIMLALGLAGIALAPTGGTVVAAALFVGLASTAAQQIVPFAANLALPERRGAVIGTISAAAMAGVLLSRTIAGYVGGNFGWRVVYWASVPIALAACAMMAIMLPANRPEARISYGRLLASLGTLWTKHPELRLATMTEALIFAAFMSFWTTMALHLQEPAIGLGPQAAGTFGLIGIAGVMTAPVIGRFADRRGAYPALIGGALVAALAWMVMALWSTLAGLVVGVVLLDVGARSVLIAGQTVVFAQDASARSRLNTIYLGSTFAGGAVGSAMAMAAWQHGGWHAVSLLGGLFAASAATLQLVHDARRRAAAAPD